MDYATECTFETNQEACICVLGDILAESVNLSVEQKKLITEQIEQFKALSETLT